MKRVMAVCVMMVVTQAALATPVTDGLVMHLAADAITGVSNGGTVANWPDLSGYNRHGIQTDFSKQPKYYTDVLDGKPAVRFDGVDDVIWLLDAGAAINLNSLSVFVVGQFTNLSKFDQYMLSGLGDTVPNSRLRIALSKSNNMPIVHYRVGNSVDRPAWSPLADANFHVYAVNSQMTGFLDGAEKGTSANSITAVPPLLNLGAIRGTSNFFEGNIAEVIIYNRVLNAEEREKVGIYLSNRYASIETVDRNTAHEPYPGDNASAVVLSDTLTWKAGLNPVDLTKVNPNIKKHYVWMSSGNGADPNMTVIGSVDVTNYDDPAADGTFALSLSQDSVYWWAVEEALDNGQGGVYPAGDPNNLFGPVWKFEAIKSTPVITANPTDTIVPLGQTGQLTVSADSLSPLQYAWYKSADNANDTPGDDEFVGDQANLTLVSVNASDEGYYYCAVYNDSGLEKAARSAVAQLGVARKVAHWTFDAADLVNGRYQDISGTGHYAEPNVVPTGASFVAGVNDKTAQAVDFTVEPQTVAQAGDWAPAAFTGQFTLSAWVKWAGANGAWQGILSNRIISSQANFYIEIRQDNGNVQIGAPYFGAGDLVGPNLPVGQWAHLAVTAAPEGFVIYINGMPVAQRIPARAINQDIYPLFIAALNRNASTGLLASPFNGIMDDVRIYNYAKDHYAISDLYFDVLETPLCLNPNNVDLRFDVAGGGVNGDQPDCKVNLLDFAAFAETWLNCGYYPQTSCN
jgi:hypothetical protein